MKNQGKLILDAELVKIYFTGNEYRVLISMSRGGMLEHEPFPGDLRGLVAAMTLATEVCAGKFFPRGVVKEEASAPKVFDRAQIGGSK